LKESELNTSTDILSTNVYLFIYLLGSMNLKINLFTYLLGHVTLQTSNMAAFAKIVFI